MSNLITIKIRRIYLILLILFSTVGCDQITKVVARDSISSAGPISYLNSTLQLEHAENPGAFLSLGAKLPEKIRTLIFTGFVSIFLFLLAFYLFRTKSDLLTTTAMSMILAGGLGNLIDRIHKGTVTDFILIKNDYASTGIFNVADVAIVAGALLFFLISFNEKKSLTHKS